MLNLGANFEYEVDLMFISTTDENVGLVAVNNFTKMVSIATIKNKQPDEIRNGLKYIVDKPGGKPKQVYRDEEAAFNSTKYIKIPNENNIKHIQTTTHAHTVERYISTFRMNLQRRLDAPDQEKNECVKHVSSILTKCKNTTHSTIKIKPVGAVKKGSHSWVSWHLWDSAKRDRKYPKTSQNDYVRIKINKRKQQKAMTQHSQKKNIKQLQ